MVPIGAALTTMMRRAPAARMAWVMALVPLAATPASALVLGPSADSIAPAPATAGWRAAGSAEARSAAMARAAVAARLCGFRATAVTSWPAAMACSSTCRPMPPVAAKIVSFIGCLPGRVSSGRSASTTQDDRGDQNVTRPNHDGLALWCCCAAGVLP